MIPVRPAEEPPTFDTEVRQPGRRAVEELVERFGDEIPASEFPPYWRRILPELLDSYNRICSYLCLRISGGTGAASVDHMVAKSVSRDLVYEWHNYRLACSLMNARKGTTSDVLDPFDVEDGWFALELVGFQVLPGGGLDADTKGAVEGTIERLRLNDVICCDVRAEYADYYWDRQIRFDHLTRHSPFVARELRRQGRLRAEDR